MPELPEVEVICRGLRPHLLGRQIVAVEGDGLCLRQPVPLLAMQATLPGQIFSALERRGKYLLFALASGWMLVIHLGMTGNLGIFSPTRQRARHDHLWWSLDDGRELRYWDSRRFGTVKLLTPAETAIREETIFQNLGPEPFSDAFSAQGLARLAKGRRVPVKAFIMSGQVVTGVGNIYASESLFAAGIHPARPAGSLSRRQWSRLVEEIRSVLLEAIACGGSTISDFINADRQRGYFQINFRVYGRGGEPCHACRAPIEGIRLAGRASYYCPHCQR